MRSPRPQELNFSLALKDFHDALRIGVQKTLVSEDGMGHAYVKIHVQRLPKAADLEREKHLKSHWVPLAGSRWVRPTVLSIRASPALKRADYLDRVVGLPVVQEFRTASHSVTCVFKTVRFSFSRSVTLSLELELTLSLSCSRRLLSQRTRRSS